MLSFNRQKTKIILILGTVASCIIGVTGAFFKVQPVYYAGMALMAVFLVLNIIGLITAAKEDKKEEEAEREALLNERDGMDDDLLKPEDIEFLNDENR